MGRSGDGLNNMCIIGDIGLNISHSQSFVPIDQQSENWSSGGNHFEITKERLLPEPSFSNRYLVTENEALGTRLYETTTICLGEEVKTLKFVKSYISSALLQDMFF